MTKPLWEIWIVDTQLGLVIQTVEPGVDAEGYLIDQVNSYTHVREVSPEYDALVREMVEALHDISHTIDKDFTSNNITAAAVLAKYNAFMKGREG